MSLFKSSEVVAPESPRSGSSSVPADDELGLRAGESMFGEASACRVLFEAMEEGSMLLTPEGRVFRVNEACARIHGYGTVGEMEAMGLADWVTPECLANTVERVRGAAGGEIQHFEAVHRRRDGVRILLKETARRLELGGRSCVMILLQDVTARNEVEEQLRRSEDRFRTLFEHSPDGLFVVEPDTGVIAAANPTATQLFGVRSEREISARVPWQLSPSIQPDGRPSGEAAREHIGKAMRDGCHAFEWTHRRMDGHDFLAQVRLVRVEQAGKSVLLATIRDISERRRAEEALAAEATRRRILIEGSRDGIVVLDRDGRVFEANRRFAEMLGYTAEELQALHVWEWDRSWSKEKVLEAIRLLGPEGARFETRHWRKDGTCFEVELSNSAAELGGQKLVFCVCHDITERKRAMEALAAREEIFSSIVGQAGDAIAVVDGSTGRFVEFNTSAHEGLGYTREEFAAFSVGDIQAEHSSSDIASNIEDIRLHGSANFETKHRHRDGSLRDARVSVRRLALRGRDYMAAVWTDISGQKRLEQQLLQAQKLEAVGQLAGGVAHDFNNILAAIMMHLGLIGTNPDLDPETRESLKELESEAGRAATLTRQLLMFSRRSVLSIRPQDLNEVVANLLKMLSRLIGENIRLCFEGASLLPSVEADAGMLEQVLMNLVVNARDAMPKGGRITIATSVADLAAEERPAHSDRRAGRFVVLSVADTGTGMDDATMKRIFEPFFTTKEAGRGTGLGLATVHGIVAQHKGWVEVESRWGEGSTFRVFLPAIAHGVGHVEKEPEPTQRLRGRETVLVVEDEGKLRHLVSRTLRGLGYRVYEAENGQHAMRMWLECGAQVDLLLTDMVMPEGMTGLELAERLRATRPGLKVIITSGYSAEIVHAGRPTQAGITYLPKPYPDQVLAAVVRQCLDRQAGDRWPPVGGG